VLFKQGLVLLTRPGCGLCEDLNDEVRQLGRHHEIPDLTTLDVDSNVELRRRYGLNIPVLLLDGAEVCRHHLDAPELLRLLRHRQ
jgi:hypothetical protein